MKSKRSLGDGEFLQDLHFPKAGVDLSMGFGKQPNRPVANGEYARTTALGLNVRGFEALTKRSRGGQRAGLVKYYPAAVVPGWMLQELTYVVGTGYPNPGGAMQTSLSGRVVTTVAVSQGNVFAAGSGATSWTPAANNAKNNPPLNFTGLMYSSANNQKLWFADGTNWVYYNPHDNTVNDWVASAGTLPADSGGNAPRLITTWRGRTVLSGLLLDSQNWFMSRVSDPTNFDYAPLSPGGKDATAGNNGPLGLVGDVVTTLIPYTDDVLIFGGDHSIYILRGDPLAGGQIDLVTESIGMAWGIPWCKDPYGTVYFISNKTGIYTLVPGQQPQRISQAIEQLLQAVDTGANGFRLMWDDRFQGLHVFVTPLVQPGPTTHFFYEQRSGAWFTDQFADPNMNPLCCVTFDGNTPGDRVPLIGSWDGFVRAVSPTATTDDGQPISSAVMIGPLLSKDLDDILLKDLQAVLGLTSGPVNYAVYVGPSAESALQSTPVASGTWTPDRNLSNFVRRAGHAVYVKLTASNPWAMEVIRARIAPQGKVRRRGR